MNFPLATRKHRSFEELVPYEYTSRQKQIIESRKIKDLPLLRPRELDFPGITVAIGTRKCHVCRSKIYRGDVHLYHWKTMRLRIFNTGGQSCNYLLPIRKRINVCFKCVEKDARDWTRMFETAQRIYGKRFYKNLPKYIKQQKMDLREILEDKL